MVKRFEMIACEGDIVVPEPDIGGEWVRYKHYAELEIENQRLRALYDDLIYQVANKHPNESRHETAKRYIMQAEQPSDNQAQEVSDE